MLDRSTTVKRRRGPCIFRQGDLTKAIRAVTAAGLSVASIQISSAGIIVTPGKPVDGAPHEGDGDHNEWDVA
jgi:hypothetical protein